MPFRTSKTGAFFEIDIAANHAGVQPTREPFPPLRERRARSSCRFAFGSACVRCSALERQPPCLYCHWNREIIFRVGSSEQFRAANTAKKSLNLDSGWNEIVTRASPCQSYWRDNLDDLIDCLTGDGGD